MEAEFVPNFFGRKMREIQQSFSFGKNSGLNILFGGFPQLRLYAAI